MSSIYTLAYASSSTFLLSQRDLERLLDEAQSKNQENGISGILLYHDGNFLQILEGPKDVVVKTYDRILHDPRHKGLIRLLSRFFPSRSFSDWSMGYVRCTEKKLEQNAPGFNLMLERDQGHLIKQNNLPDPLYDLLLSFHRVVYKTNMKVVDPLSITS